MIKARRNIITYIGLGIGVCLVIAIVSYLFLQVRNNTRHLVKFQSGHYYYGNMKGGKANGYGELLDPSGEIYTGYFRNGLFEGSGVSVFPLGDVYCGDFKEGMMSGEGMYTFVNGENYRGHFKNNMFNGFGIVRKECGVMRYCGNWINGQINGVLFNERISYENHGQIRRHVEKKIHMDNRDVPDQIIMHHNHVMQLTESFNCHAQTLFTLYDSIGNLKPGIGAFIDRFGTSIFVSNRNEEVVASDYLYQFRSPKFQFIDRYLDDEIVNYNYKTTIIQSFDRQNVIYFHLTDIRNNMKFCEPCMVLGLVDTIIVSRHAIVNYSDRNTLIIEIPDGLNNTFIPYMILDKQAKLAGFPESVLSNTKLKCSVPSHSIKKWFTSDSLTTKPINSWMLFPDLIDIAKNTVDDILNPAIQDSLSTEAFFVFNDQYNMRVGDVVTDSVFLKNLKSAVEEKEVFDSTEIFRILYPQQTILDVRHGDGENKFSIVFDKDNKVVSLREYTTEFKQYEFKSY